jgi:hypothetical protein
MRGEKVTDEVWNSIAEESPEAATVALD